MKRTTADHTEIKKWAEKYHGQPQIIDDSIAKADKVGIRIDFPGNKDDVFLPESKVKPISWEEFFKIFDDQKLSLIYEENVDTNKFSDVFYSYQFIKKDAVKEGT